MLGPIRAMFFAQAKHINHASEEFNPPGAPRDLPSLNELPYLTMRDSPSGSTSKAATVAVTTLVVSLLI
jgi:hypothetical protein